MKVSIQLRNKRWRIFVVIIITIIKSLDSLYSSQNRYSSLASDMAKVSHPLSIVSSSFKAAEGKRAKKS